jgi:hypothetical protein
LWKLARPSLACVLAGVASFIGFGVYQKISVAISAITYGIPTDFDNKRRYYLECAKVKVYLRVPNEESTKRLMTINKKVWQGMLESIDAMSVIIVLCDV